MIAREVSVPVVDDDRIDTMAVCRSFRELGIANPMIEACDGIEGLARLGGGNRYPILPSPRLVLLDLHMSRMDGFEFLDELRADPALRRTVVFVMTTSTAAVPKAVSG
jgi:CheY-like chemotaxis protein